MAVKMISFDELMSECNFEDIADFKRVLRKNGFSVPRNKPVERALADNVAKRLIGRKIDWYKYKQEQRDILSGGALERQSLLSHQEASQFFKLLDISDYQPFLSKDGLIGVVSSGGFLANSNETIFALKLTPGINVLIGDRGSGKSTALSLIGLLADSVSEETGILVDNLLGLLNSDSQGSKFSRQVRRNLSKYGIDEYACFYTLAGKLFCFYVSSKQEAFDFLQYHNNHWMSINTSIEVKPKTQVLRQGEVIQIADAQNNFYLNNILDALFPDLYAQREALVRKTHKFLEQINNHKKINIPLKAEYIQQFIRRCKRDLRQLRFEIVRGFISGSSIGILENYIRIYDSLDKRALANKSIVEILKIGNSGSLYYLYLSRIISFLSRETGKMRAIERQRYQLRFTEVHAKANQETDFLKLEYNDEGEDSAEYVQLIQEMEEDKQNLDSDIAAPEDADSEDTDSAVEFDAEESKLFLQYMEEENNPLLKRLNGNLLAIAETIEDFLRIRLGILETWSRYYGKDFFVCDDSLVALAENYKQLLDERYDLIKTQEAKCCYITEALNKDNLEINIYTSGLEEREQEIAIAENMFNNLYVSYLAVTRDKPDTPLWIWRTRTYKRSIDYLFEVLKILRQHIESSTNNDFLFTPIEITMRQGNLNRDFRQLSFGQKSSVILDMVFQSNDKSVLIVDQPEDNLDAHSIVKILAPTLNRLGSEKQVIIATHNSNLVLGLKTDNVIVLESSGDTGRIKFQGSPLQDKYIMESMVEILEGGLDSFELKIKTFEEFASRVSGQIRDIDITMIESSFRRRTIDDLRNFLQPIVSDKAMLDFARHELKQGRPAIIQQDAVALAEFTRQHRHILPYNENFLERIDKLFHDLNSHIETLKSSIENIRLMDTHPNSTEVNLYALLEEIKDKLVMPRLRRSRRNVAIEIDERIKGYYVLFDEGHLKLIFHNLINNSLRATELKSVMMMPNTHNNYQEKVIIRLEKIQGNNLRVLLTDNGRGIPKNLRDKLYVERCSDQRGRDDGLGGVTIRKLLDINSGNIQVLQTVPEFDGTMQILTLPLISGDNLKSESFSL